MGPESSLPPPGPTSPDRVASSTVRLLEVDGSGSNEDLVGHMKDRSGPGEQGVEHKEHETLRQGKRGAGLREGEAEAEETEDLT